MREHTVSSFDTINKVIAFLASIASIVALTLTLVVFAKIKKIRRAFLTTARAPELLAELSIDGAKLQEVLNEVRSTYTLPVLYVKPPQSDVIGRVLESCKSNLNGLQSKIDAPGKGSALSLIAAIDAISKTSPKIDEVARVESKLVGVITDVRNELKDKKYN